jgi:hypothetical protein
MPEVAFAVFGPVQGYFIPGGDSRMLEYRLGHRGAVKLPEGAMDEAARKAVLGRLFTDGNGMGEGDGFTVNGRSMSSGDIVTVGGCGTWRCDSFGWTEIIGAEAHRFPVNGADHCPVLQDQAARGSLAPMRPVAPGAAR